MPGDACSPANAFNVSGGPETSGKTYFMTCQSSVWQLIYATDTAGNVGIGLASPGVRLSVANGTASAGVLGIYEDADDGTNYASFTVPALSANTVYTLPADDGAAGEQLQTNGSGVLTWEAAGGSGTPAGSSTQVQFNDSGSFGGDAGLTYDKTNDALTVSGKITLGSTTGLTTPINGFVAGSNTQIQYNNNGAFGASASLTWNPTTSTLATGGLALTPPSVITLTADNTLVTTAGRSYVRLTSDNTTATNRTFCLDAGTAGQVITIEWTSGTNKGELADNGTACTSSVATALSATWTPAAADATMMLIYNGTKWLQTAVTVN